MFEYLLCVQCTTACFVNMLHGIFCRVGLLARLSGLAGLSGNLMRNALFFSVYKEF